MTDEGLLTTTEAAEYLGQTVTPHALRHAARVGKIVAHRTIGGHLRFDPAELDRHRPTLEPRKDTT